MLWEDFCLHKQIAECRLHQVRRSSRQNYLCITGNVNCSALSRTIGYKDPPHFDIVLRRYHNLSMRFYLIEGGMKVHTTLGKSNFVPFSFFKRWLVCIRPVLSAFAVPYVTKSAPIVAGAVFMPARNGKIFPADRATPGICYHYM